MTTMGCDIVTAALEYDEFEGATSYSAPPPPPPSPSLKELVPSLVDARDRARAVLFIGEDWTDELSFSHYYHQHWANQVCWSPSSGDKWERPMDGRRLVVVHPSLVWASSLTSGWSVLCYFGSFPLCPPGIYVL